MACISPYFSQVKGSWMPFPCGRCPPCAKRRIDGWVFRMLQEEKNHLFSHFVTLTYDPMHLPVSPNGHMTLDKSEFPRFMKRLRKIVPRGTILKYFACGEYGTDNSRPHYHAIIFGCPDVNLFADAWTLNSEPIGLIDVGQVSGDSIAYTVGYINKKASVTPRRGDDRVPEFSLMSKGLGESYCTLAAYEYHQADLNRNYLTKDGGSIVAMPRYYRERLYSEIDRDLQQSLAAKAVGESNSEQYALFMKHYSNVDGYDFRQYVEETRKGVAARSFNFSKKRKL